MRLKHYALVVALTLLVAGVLAVGAGLLEARGVRSHPTKSHVVRLMNSRRPDAIVARVLLFRPGSEPYEDSLRSWLFISEPAFPDSMLNRWLLTGELQRMSEEQRQVHLSQYPLTPGPEVTALATAALRGGDTEVFPLLLRTESGKANARSWVVAALRSGELMLSAVPGLIPSDAITPLELVRHVLPTLDRGYPELCEAIAIRVANSPESHDGIAEWLQVNLRDYQFEHYEFGFGPILRVVAQNEHLRGRIEDVIRASADSLSRMRTEADEDNPEATSAGALMGGLFDCETAESITSDPHQHVQRSLARILFDALSDKGPRAISDAIHQVAHRSVDFAEVLARDVLAGPDSSLRKDAIVLLVRHGSIQAGARIDDAFVGGAPRNEMLRRQDYATTSNAAVEYSRLARHDYLETGKAFPPLGSPPTPTEDEVEAWMRFIAKYPWFPGTDDAYYRAAYLYFAMKEDERSVALVEAAFSQPLPDTDAFPFLSLLLRHIAVAGVAPSGRMGLQQLRTLYENPPGIALLEERPPIDEIQGAIEWLLADERRPALANATPEELEPLRAIVPLLEVPDIGRRLRAASGVPGLTPRALYFDFNSGLRTLELPGRLGAEATPEGITSAARTIALLLSTQDERRQGELARWVKWHVDSRDPRARASMGPLLTAFTAEGRGRPE